MAMAVPSEAIGSGPIVELGAGTGPVTAALISRGVPQEDLYVVEKSDALASGLAERFPRARVLCRSAAEIADELPGPARAVVSSLPFRSLPLDVCRDIMEELDRVLAPGGLYIQFTYALFGALPFAPANYENVRTAFAPLNVPPAKVVVLRKPA